MGGPTAPSSSQLSASLFLGDPQRWPCSLSSLWPLGCKANKRLSGQGHSALYPTPQWHLKKPCVGRGAPRPIWLMCPRGLSRPLLDPSPGVTKERGLLLGAWESKARQEKP